MSTEMLIAEHAVQDLNTKIGGVLTDSVADLHAGARTISGLDCRFPAECAVGLTVQVVTCGKAGTDAEVPEGASRTRPDDPVDLTWTVSKKEQGSLGCAHLQIGQ
jgi:hypothetical protein